MRINAALLAIALSIVLSARPLLAAVACSVLTQSNSTTNDTSYATASITPSANALVLLATLASRNTADACTDNDVSSVSGNGLTWVKIDNQCFSTAGIPTQTIELWRSMGASPSTGAVTISFGGSTQLNAAWAVLECTGADTSGTNGSGAVVQSAKNTAEPGTSVTATLAAFGSANNATLGVFGAADNLAITPGSGFSELAEQQVSDSGNDGTLQVEFLASNDTTVDASATSIDLAALAIEIKADSATSLFGPLRRRF